MNSSMAGVTQGIELSPANGKVNSLVPNWGTCLGCGLGPQLGTRWLIAVSLTHGCFSFSLLALSLEVNK